MDTPVAPPTPEQPIPPTPLSTKEPISPNVQSFLAQQPHAEQPIQPHHTKRFFSILLALVVLILMIIAGVLGYMIFMNKPTQELTTTQTTTSSFPTAIPTVVIDPVTSWDTYSDPQLGLTFKYPAETYTVSVVPLANYKSALKPNYVVWVAVPAGDMVPVEVLYYRSSLSAAEWWETKGAALFNQVQIDFQNAQDPKPSAYPTPEFMMTEVSVGGQDAIRVTGNVVAAQGFGNITLTILKTEQGIVLFKQSEDGKSDSDKILSSVTFDAEPTVLPTSVVTPTETTEAE